MCDMISYYVWGRIDSENDHDDEDYVGDDDNNNCNDFFLFISIPQYGCLSVDKYVNPGW